MRKNFVYAFREVDIHNQLQQYLTINGETVRVISRPLDVYKTFSSQYPSIAARYELGKNLVAVFDKKATLSNQYKKKKYKPKAYSKQAQTELHQTREWKDEYGQEES